MLLTSENYEIRFLEADIKYKLREFIEQRKFRVSDSQLTYRQINNLAAVGILSTAQEKEGGWRKFSFAELVFLDVVHELRHLGFKTEQLHSLQEAFFTAEKTKTVPSINIPESEGYAFIAIGMTMTAIQIVLTVDADGSVAFYDSLNFSMFGNRDRAFAYINLNKVVNDILKKLGHKGFDYETLLELFIGGQLSKDDLDEKERALFEAIRGDEYETVEVVQENGKIKMFRGTRHERGNFSPQELMAALQEKSYQTLTVHMQNGNAISYTVKETRK